jgi:glycosyltransferase 2 family protein
LKQDTSLFQFKKILLPLGCSLAAVGFLLFRTFKSGDFSSVVFDQRTIVWIGVAVGLFLLRHAMYAYRLHGLTGGYFSYLKCLQLMVLWESGSALTPTSKGGPLLMLWVFSKEHLNAGRSAATVCYAMVCDSGFFVGVLPLVLGIYGNDMLRPGNAGAYVTLASGTFWTVYIMMSAVWLALVTLLFIHPQWIGDLLQWAGHHRWLSRWQARLARWGHEFTMAAQTLRQCPPLLHLRIWGCTFAVWTLKFLMINALMVAFDPFIPVDGHTQAFVYARLLAMFVMLTFSPTPGGSGVIELMLPVFLSDLISYPAQAVVVTLVWRGIAWYGYLIAGSVVVPYWWNRVSGRVSGLGR